MLKNMKVKQCLLVGFGASILIPTILLIAAVFLMTTQRANFENIIDTDIRASSAITEARMHANIAARHLRDMALDPSADQDAARQQTITDEVNKLDACIDEMKTLTNDSRVYDYEAAMGEWKAEVDPIIRMINSDQLTEAADEIVNRCTPKLTAAATISDALDASLTAHAEQSIEAQSRTSMIATAVIIAVIVVSVILILAVAFKIIRLITVPVEQVRSALEGISQGKLDQKVEYEAKSELGEMCDALRTTQDMLSECISDTCRLLEEMGNGNFDVRSKDANMYVGDMSGILTSVRVINRSLSDALTQISQSAEQVSAGAEQVSTGAQSLAQGATEQASAVEELSATIAEISNNARKNAQNSEEAMGHSQDAGKCINESSEYMQQMVHAMEKISESSSEIGKIIATIENIAFQTNILALNAAVEAARAGSAGKGFAVVADEVRNLSAKSDEAAKATKELIDRSIVSVKEGNEIVQKVSESLDKTVESSGKVVAAVEQITKAAEEESEAIAQVTEGIDQISSVVQTNSATSEESAAASEELSSQASLMKELLSRFKLRQDGYSPKSQLPAYSAASSSGSYEDYEAPASSSSASSVFSKY